MRRYRYNILAVCMMLMPLMVSAQEKQNQRQVYEKAEEAYQIGPHKMTRTNLSSMHEHC